MPGPGCSAAGSGRLLRCPQASPWKNAAHTARQAARGAPAPPWLSTRQFSPWSLAQGAQNTPRCVGQASLAMPELQRPKRCLEEPPTYTTTPGARRLWLAGSSQQRCGWPCSWFLRVLEPSRNCCVTWAGAETSTRPLLPAQHPRPGSSRAPTDRAAGTLHPLLGPPRAWVARQSGPEAGARSLVGP